MTCQENCIDLSEYKADFDRIQAIVYKDIYINNFCLRVLGIHYMDNGPNWYVGKHKHSFFELHYVTGGHVFTSIKKNEYKIEPGCFYLMPPGVLHSHCQKDEIGHIGFALRWEFIKPNKGNPSNSHEFDQFSQMISNVHSYPIKDNGSFVEGLLKLLRKSREGSFLLEIQLAFLQLLIDLGDFYRCEMGENPLEINHTFYENNVINSAIQFIEENYTQEIKAKDISNSMNISYSHFSRLFKKYTGDTITCYINKIRLAKAQLLLKCSEKNITEIAEDVGFNSEYYFSGIFKKYYGVSPRNYRKAETELLD